MLGTQSSLLTAYLRLVCQFTTWGGLSLGRKAQLASSLSLSVGVQETKLPSGGRGSHSCDRNTGNTGFTAFESP